MLDLNRYDLLLWWITGMYSDTPEHLPARIDPALFEQAQELAEGAYQVVTFHSEQPLLYGWIAYHPELRGCIVDGRNRSEAVRVLRHIRTGYIYELLAQGRSVPPPHHGPLPDGCYTSIVWLEPPSDTNDYEQDNAKGRRD